MTCLNAGANRIREIADEARILVAESLARVGVGHLGGCLSCVDILSALYFGIMDVDPENPRWVFRDRFVLSKGHAGPALYAILALRGFFPVSVLASINEGGTRLPSHADMRLTPGVDMTAGSLGQGISCAAGMAYAARLDGHSNRVFALVGDGECQEGEVWEAAMTASGLGLDNLIVVIDNNGLQIDGFTSEIIPVEPLAARWTSFGFHVLEVDGHDSAALLDALMCAARPHEKPSCIVARTVKCKGVPMAENTPGCHNMPVTREHVAALRQTVQSGRG